MYNNIYYIIINMNQVNKFNLNLNNFEYQIILMYFILNYLTNVIYY